jgi:hypothetical protein
LGFPIRTSPAVAPAHGSPELIAVYHVLHRHLTPRHPPCALSCEPLAVIRRRGYSRLACYSPCACYFCVFAYVVVKLRGPPESRPGRGGDFPLPRPPTPVGDPRRLMSPINKTARYIYRAAKSPVSDIPSQIIQLKIPVCSSSVRPCVSSNVVVLIILSDPGWVVK